MDTNHHSHAATNPDVGFEYSDLSVRGILIFLIGVGVAGVVTHLIIWVLFLGAKKLVPYETNSNPMATMTTGVEAPPLTNAGPQSVVKFAEPRLQTDDTADMSKFRESEQKVLYTSKPYRADDGSLHININDAMKLLAQRGMPTRQSTPANATSTAPQLESGAKPTGGKPGAE